MAGKSEKIEMVHANVCAIRHHFYNPFQGLLYMFKKPKSERKQDKDDVTHQDASDLL